MEQVDHEDGHNELVEVGNHGTEQEDSLDAVVVGEAAAHFQQEEPGNCTGAVRPDRPGPMAVHVHHTAWVDVDHFDRVVHPDQPREREHWGRRGQKPARRLLETILDGKGIVD